MNYTYCRYFKVEKIDHKFYSNYFVYYRNNYPSISIKKESKKEA